MSKLTEFLEGINLTIMKKGTFNKVLSFIKKLTVEESIPPFWYGIRQVEDAIENNRGIVHNTGTSICHSIMDSLNDDIDKDVVNIVLNNIKLRKSNDASCCILNVYNNSELWIIRLHDISLVTDLNVSGIYNTIGYFSTTPDNESHHKTIGVIVMGKESDYNKDVYTQVLRHEFTHYYIEYLCSFCDSLEKPIMNIKKSGDLVIEFLCDAIQFFLNPERTNFEDNLRDFKGYIETNFREETLNQYKQLFGINDN